MRVAIVVSRQTQPRAPSNKNPCRAGGGSDDVLAEGLFGHFVRNSFALSP